MSKPDDIEQWAWDEAKKHEMAAFAARSLGRKVTDTEVIARAILSERTKAAEIALALKPEGGGKIVDPRRDHAHRISQAIRKGGKE